MLIATVVTMTVLTSIPMSWAALRFWATHLMAFPGFVLYRNSCRAQTQINAVIIMAILALEITTLPIFTVPTRNPGTEKGTGPQNSRIPSTMIFPSMTVAMIV